MDSSLEAIRLDVSDYLEKPFRLRDVVAAIRFIRAHAHQGVGAGAGRPVGEPDVEDAAHQPAEHHAHEEAGREDAARIARAQRDAGGDDLHDQQQGEGAEQDLALHRGTDGLVARAQGMRRP